MTHNIVNIKSTTTSILIEDYSSVCNQVMDYIYSFQSEDEIDNHNYNLKREHTNKVIGYTEVLTRSLKCDEDTILIAEMSALLHDVGRFEQYRIYKSFLDSESKDHAEIALKLIEENGWLDTLTKFSKNMIKKVIYYHNKYSISETENPAVVFISKILRDADKIDILDIASKEFSEETKIKNPAFSYNLKESDEISRPVLLSMLSGKMPNKSDLRTVADFKMLQISLVYDINFRESFLIINKNKYLKRIFETLPLNDEIYEAYNKARVYVENRLT